MEFAAEIAIPVVGVIVCALLVFAFGFKSPGQPPSFDFDDRKKNRKGKQKTSRSGINGHIPAASSEESSPKQPSGGKSPRATPSSSSTGASSAKSNTASKDNKKVVKKSISAPKPVSGEKPVTSEQEDDDGWMTQVSKKGKKQRGKKEEQEVVEKKTPREETTAETPAVETKEPEPVAIQPDSPPLEKRKKKSRKTTKSPTEEVVVTPVEKKDEPKEAPVVESIPEKETPAPIVEPTEVPEVNLQEKIEEEVEEETETKPSKPVVKKKEILDDFEIPDVYSKPSPAEPATLPLIKSAKSPKKTKKEKRLESQMAKQASSAVETDQRLSEVLPTKESSSSPTTEEKQLSDAMLDIPSKPVISPDSSSSGSQETSVTAQTENVTFDEIGDSWIEAKVKTKKKKARREN